MIINLILFIMISLLIPYGHNGILNIVLKPVGIVSLVLLLLLQMMLIVVVGIIRPLIGVDVVSRDAVVLMTMLWRKRMRLMMTLLLFFLSMLMLMHHPDLVTIFTSLSAVLDVPLVHVLVHVVPHVVLHNLLRCSLILLASSPNILFSSLLVIFLQR